MAADGLLAMAKLLAGCPDYGGAGSLPAAILHLDIGRDQVFGVL